MYITCMNDKRKDAPADLDGLLHTAGTAQAYVESKLDAASLSLAKLAALSALVEAGDSLPLGQLAERLACVKSNITQLVDRLEADGLVARQLDPDDRRTRLAVVTATGRKAYEVGTDIRRRTERELFAALTREEADQLAGLMKKLGRRLH
jgi:DNA-binding MarR family transcriptional regulator